jgi:hypothetical protein
MNHVEADVTRSEKGRSLGCPTLISYSAAEVRSVRTGIHAQPRIAGAGRLAAGIAVSPFEWPDNARDLQSDDYWSPKLGYMVVVVDEHRPVPGAERWSYRSIGFDRETETRTVALARDDGRAAAFSVPEFVSEPLDLRAIALIVIDACERWENRQGVGG